MARRLFAILDDVAGAAKIATGKTAGILADELFVNAEKAAGFLAVVKGQWQRKSDRCA